MKTKLILLSSIILLIVACKSYEPFSSAKEKRQRVKTIKNVFQLTNTEFDKIKKEDSILFLVSNSLKKEIKLSLTERRLDSFFTNRYDVEETKIMLKLDFNFPNLKSPFELDRNNKGKRLEINSMKDLKKFMNGGRDKKIDSLFGFKQKKNDSIKTKKND